MRGKRRLHKRPNNYEIERCKIWLDEERRLVKPEAIIALGVSAARSLTGKTVTISKLRGKPLDLADGTRLFITMHPSALLRMGDDKDKQKAYRQLVADLTAAASAVK
jgi:DNA polymerase